MKRFHSDSASREQRLRPREGRWAFSLASESLFALGATEQVRRVAYLGPKGELRFLPSSK